jgi:GH15 family glucan-1,4-alpha-glucosidase
MPARIEDYALIGDCHTAALVSREGSIDWLCLPRFDSGACFAALLGTPDNGSWKIAPVGESKSVRRRYREDTLVLETEYETAEGVATVVDCMPPMGASHDLVRRITGKRGRVAFRSALVIRFDYGWLVPWVRRADGGIVAVAGPDTLRVRSDVRMHGENFKTVADFTVARDQSASFVLTWHPSHRELPPPLDASEAVAATVRWWKRWSRRCTYNGPWREAVMRSLLTLKALTYSPTGGIVAAATTSLPEQPGGVRNWDYRYCWLRDATFALYALLTNGYRTEARAWREWLLRAVAGKAEQLNIMYGLAGERRLPELTLPWLPGYEGAHPVRIGNAAHEQFQLDVFGEIAAMLHLERRSSLAPDHGAWAVEASLLNFLESRWTEPDDGIWEVRGARRHFTHSKVMAWVAFDRAVRDIERYRLQGPIDRWREIRNRIHVEVCDKGYEAARGTFVQSYGGTALDASLLMMPFVGFLPIGDERMRGTIAAIERELVRDGFVQRYTHQEEVDGLPPGEGAFLMCTFWLADCYALMGRRAEACQLFERLLAVRNDVGLLAEEYDPAARRLLGNFPQVFSHVGLVNTAVNLSRRQSETAMTPRRKRGRHAARSRR